MATAKTTESRDFYANMPAWQREQLMGDAAFETEFRNAMSATANRADKPRKIAGLGQGEKNAVNAMGRATNTLTTGLGKQVRAVNGIDVADGLGAIRNPKAMGGVATAGRWRDVAAPDDTFNTITGPTAADVDAMRAKYTSGYTDDVVNTTLAGMDRNAQREQLARDARGAAIGGTSNSRSAVADAVAGSLHSMDRASTEAKLRDTAFNTAANYGLQEADMANEFGWNTANFSAEQEALARQYGLDLADFGLSQEQSRSAHDRALADQSLAAARAKAENELALSGFNLERAVAEAGQGNTAAKLALEKAGLTAEMLQSAFDARTGTAAARGSLAAEARDLRQQQIDSNYYSPMEAGSWLAEVYSGTRTRDSAPYNYTSDSKTSDGKKDPSKWQQVLGGITAGLNSFL